MKVSLSRSLARSGIISGMTIPRGDATQAVFESTTAATHIAHNTYEGTDEVTRISIDAAEALFEQNPNVSMERRLDDVYVFVVTNPRGYERVEIDGGHGTAP
jgi:hypothetical protein